MDEYNILNFILRLRNLDTLCIDLTLFNF